MDSFEPLSWYALRTRPRQEERAVQNLRAWNVETMLAKLREPGKNGKPQVLFPGYIFARFDVHQMLHKISFTRGVLYVVAFGGKPAAIGDDIIAAMTEHALIARPREHLPILKPGDLVVVTAGPLRTFMGVFKKNLPGPARVEILLNTVAYSARVQLSRTDLQVLDSGGQCQALSA